MTEKEEGHDYGTVVWMHARIAVEGLHAAIWVFLVLAAFLFPTSSLIFPILLLMCVPIGWKAAGACPLSILEDYLHPLQEDRKGLLFQRNRTGTKIREILHININTWDNMLKYLTCLIAVLYALRMCACLATSATSRL